MYLELYKFRAIAVTGKYASLQFLSLGSLKEVKLESYSCSGGGGETR